jgi:3'(2'), 5'-bisphosphate nucleotidase
MPSFVDSDLASPTDGPLADAMTTLMSRAAAAVMAIDLSAVATRMKADRSPVTAADHAAQSVILDGLSHFLPGVPIVSEEANPAEMTLDKDATFVLLDPLDGTREYLAGRPEFTINLAIVRRGIPVFGCISAPALGLVWRGVAGDGAMRLALTPGADAGTCRDRIAITTRPLADPPVVAVSRSHFDDDTARLLAHFPHAQRVAYGSALKFCRLAEGSVDLYPRLAPTHEWDVAAGHAIVAAAGGVVMRPDGSPLVYGQAAGDAIVPGFIAVGDRAAAARISSLATPC